MWKIFSNNNFLILPTSTEKICHKYFSDFSLKLSSHNSIDFVQETFTIINSRVCYLHVIIVTCSQSHSPQHFWQKNCNCIMLLFAGKLHERRRLRGLLLCHDAGPYLHVSWGCTDQRRTNSRLTVNRIAKCRLCRFWEQHLLCSGQWPSINGNINQSPLKKVQVVMNRN